MAIHGKTLMDKIRSDQIRQLSGIQGIIKWANVRRKEWDGHVERMEGNRLAKIARDNLPQGVGSRGRPKKRLKESFNAAPSPERLDKQALGYRKIKDEKDEEFIVKRDTL
jgi:hypothetical protein